MNDLNLDTIARDYLGALEARDIPRCMGFFTDDAGLNWQGGVYRGRDAIEQWHRDRFDADLRIVEIEGVQVDGDRVLLDVLVTSDRLRAWRLKSLAGRATIHFCGNLINEVGFKVRVTNPFEQWG